MHPQVEKFLKISLATRILMVLGLMVVIGVAFFFLLFRPRQAEYNQFIAQSNDLQTQIVQKKSIADNLDKFQEEYKKMQQRLEESLKELPNDKEIPQLLVSIASLAKQNRLDIKRFQPGAEASKGFYAEVPVALTLMGSYHDIGKFFYDISEMPRIVNLGGVKVGVAQGAKDGSSSVVAVNVDCQATTYRFLNTAGAGQQGQKQTPGTDKK